MSTNPDRDARSTFAAEADLALLSSALAAYRARYAWNRHALARWLGITLDQLDTLALEPLPALPMHPDACRALAERHAADAGRLAAILAQGAQGPSGR
jgi:outer membrane protein TolC